MVALTTTPPSSSNRSKPMRMRKKRPRSSAASAALALLGAGAGCLLLLLSGDGGGDTIARRMSTSTSRTSSTGNNNEARLAVFYNLYVGEASDVGRVKELVSEQFSSLLSNVAPERTADNESAGMADASKESSVPFQSLSIEVTNIGIPLDLSTEITQLQPSHLPSHVSYHQDYVDEGDEALTLTKLWDHCQAHTEEGSVVTYLHSKGSYHPSELNDRLRSFLTRGATSKECYQAVSSTANTNTNAVEAESGADAQKCDICSSRFSPLPHPHVSGNMWTARCSYIRQLIDPRHFEERMGEFFRASGVPHDSIIGANRYSQEHWAHCHPDARPCDVYDGSFYWNYPGEGQVPERNDEFQFDLKKAPRYDYQLYDSVWLGWDWARLSREKELELRLGEYEHLYQTVPGEGWYGWDFHRKEEMK